MQPSIQMSHARSTSYLRYLSIISGGLYISVVFFSYSSYALPMAFCFKSVGKLFISSQYIKLSLSYALPKSATLNFWCFKRMFSTLRSLCAIPYWCMCCTPWQMSFMIDNITCSYIFILHAFSMSTRVNPPSQSSHIISI